MIIFEDRLGQGQARPIVWPDLDPNCLFKNKKPLFRESNILRKETMQSKAVLISVENNTGQDQPRLIWKRTGRYSGVTFEKFRGIIVFRGQNSVSSTSDHEFI